MSDVRFHNPPVRHVESPDFPSDDDLSESLLEQGVTSIHMEVPVTSFQLGTTMIKQSYTDMVVYSLVEDLEGTAMVPSNVDESALENDLGDNEEFLAKHQSSESDPQQTFIDTSAQREVHYISWHIFEKGLHFPAAMVSIPYEDISAIDFRIIGAGDGDTLHRPYAQLTIEVTDPPDVQHLTPSNQSVGLCSCGEGDLETIQDRVADTLSDTLFDHTPSEMGGVGLKNGFLSVGTDSGRTAIERTKSAVVGNAGSDGSAQEPPAVSGISRTKSAIPRVDQQLEGDIVVHDVKHKQDVPSQIREKDLPATVDYTGKPRAPTSFHESFERRSSPTASQTGASEKQSSLISGKTGAFENQFSPIPSTTGASASLRADGWKSSRVVDSDSPSNARGQQIAYIETTPDDSDEQIANIDTTPDNPDEQIANIDTTPDNPDEQVAKIEITSDDPDEQIANIDTTPDDPETAPVLGNELTAIIEKVEDATRTGYVKLQDMVAQVDGDDDDPAYHHDQHRAESESPSNQTKGVASGRGQSRIASGLDTGGKFERVKDDCKSVCAKPSPAEVRAHLQEVQRDGQDSSSTHSDSRLSYDSHLAAHSHTNNQTGYDEDPSHNTPTASDEDVEPTDDHTMEDRGIHCNCAADAQKRRVSSQTIKDVAKAFWTKPTLDRGKVKQHVTFFLKRLQKHFNKGKSPKTQNPARDLRRANQISHTCQLAQPQTYVITTTVGIADIGPMAIIIDQLTEISFRNKHGHIVKRGVPSWAASFPRYTPAVRRTAEVMIFTWTVLSLAWALWQLYHYIDVVPQFVRWNVSKALALIDTLVYGYLEKFDVWLTAFTTDFFLQYRPLYVVAVPLINRIYAPLRTCWYTVKRFFDLGLYTSLSRLWAGIWAFLTIGTGPIFYILGLVRTVLTPFLHVFGMIMSPLNSAAQYSFVAETERMSKIWRVITTQAQIVILAVPNLFRWIFNTILRKQVEVGDVDHMDPLLKKLLENDMPHKRSSTPDGRHLHTPDQLGADMGHRVPSFPTLASGNTSDQSVDTSFNSASSRGSLGSLHTLHGTSMHRRNIMSNIALRNANSPRRSPHGSPRLRYNSYSQRGTKADMRTSLDVKDLNARQFSGDAVSGS